MFYKTYNCLFLGTSISSFSEYKYCEFLCEFGVHSFGYWRRECFCSKCTASFSCIPFGSLLETADPYVLPLEGALLESPLPPFTNNHPFLRNWSEYFALRGFSNTSPIAILLQWPLTLYYICSQLLPEDYGFDLAHVNTLRIVIAGAAKEADMIGVFREFVRLLSLRSSVPALQVHLRLVGPAVGSGVRAVRVDEQLDTCKSGGPSVHLTVECERGLFPSPGHFPGPGLKNDAVEWRPHLVLAFNAGICAYETWLDALRYCYAERIPFYASDFTRAACDRAIAAFARAEAPAARLSSQCIQISAARPNPFRSPARRYLPELSEEAAFENAFIQHLVF